MKDLYPYDSSITPMYGVRVGLTMKKATDDTLSLYSSHISLRSCIYVPTKHKETLYCIDRSKISKEQPLYSILDTKTKSKDKYISEYENSKTMNISTLMSQLQIAGYYNKHRY